MRISNLDLNLLLVLETVLSEGSVVGAAHRLHLTPSAISNALARLRPVLDDPLVLRSGRGIVPTPRAAEIAPTLSRALRDLEQAVYGTTFDPLSTTREFTLAIADSGQVVRLPGLASMFTNEMPRATLHVVGIDTLLSSGGLSSTDVDVAIAAFPKLTPGLHARPLFKEKAVLTVSRRHPMAAAQLDTSQLATLRYVDVEVAPGKVYRDLPAAYARLGIQRDVALTVPTFVAAAAIVGTTELAAMLPESLVRAVRDDLNIRAIASPLDRIAVDLQLVWHERTDADPAMRAFRDLIVRSAAQQRVPTRRAAKIVKRERRR